MSHIPAKIVLKSTTSKTLNDRFTEMAKKQIRSPPQVTITGVRSNQFQMSQASMKNRRLAAQMANRPGVQAALGGNTSSLKSRLGSPTRGRGINAKGQLKNRLGTSPTGVVGRTRGRGRGSSFGGGFRQGRGLGSNMRGGVRGKRGGSGVVRGGRGMQGAGRGARGGRGMQGAGRGARGGRGAARGRGRGRGRGDKPVSRDKLDEELDKYMSKTKSHLDAELDEYMQHAEEDNE
ncbi:uncharacterized protein LOC144644937 isoform X1 [Oculina patagonica]